MGKLYRSEDKVIAGVCAGLAENFGFNVKVMRIIFAVCLFLGGSAAVLYIILWVLMPEKKNDKSYAERMRERIEREG